MEMEMETCAWNVVSWFLSYSYYGVKVLHALAQL